MPERSLTAARLIAILDLWQPRQDQPIGRSRPAQLRDSSMTAQPASTSAAANFTGFPSEGLRFLRDLADNNNPDWFKPRRGDYDALVRGPMVALVADVLTLAAERRLPLTGEPEQAVFRIHRDIRFSRDKRPYKTHCGASLSRTGKKLAPGLLYIHIEPAGCFVAAGFWHPEPPLLHRLRQRILTDPDRFLHVVRALDRGGMPIGPDDEATKRLPRGCEPGQGTEVEPFLKHRSFIARRSLDEAETGSPGLPALLLDCFAAARPLLDFGWDVADA
nr:DUF2461 domain-containing protein [uncultured Rhodopila sp.]